MRNELQAIIKTYLRGLALRTRARMGLTQEQMAEHLSMNTRSYIDIERGVCMCGTLTTLILLMDQPDPLVALSELEEKFKKLYEAYETEGLAL